MIRSYYASNHIKNRRKIMYISLVIKKCAQSLVNKIKRGNSMEKKNNNIEGIGFIKSRKAEATIDKIAELICTKAKEYTIGRPKILIDDGWHTDIDRPAIDTLFKYLHCEFIKYLFIRRIMEIY